MRPFREGWWQSRRQRAPRGSSRDLMGPHEGPEPQYSTFIWLWTFLRASPRTPAWHWDTLQESPACGSPGELGQTGELGREGGSLALTAPISALKELCSLVYQTLAVPALTCYHSFPKLPGPRLLPVSPRFSKAGTASFFFFPLFTHSFIHFW